MLRYSMEGKWLGKRFMAILQTYEPELGSFALQTDLTRDGQLSEIHCQFRKGAFFRPSHIFQGISFILRIALR